MPQPIDYIGAMGGMANIGGVPEAVQSALLGQQQLQQNNNVLAESTRADEVRKAQAIAIDPNADEGHKALALDVIRQNAPDQYAAMQKQQRMTQDFHALSEAPTARNVGLFMMQHPELHEGIQKGFDVLSNGQKEAVTRTAADVKGFLDAGDSAGALKVLQAHKDADQAAGIDVSSYDPLSDMITKNPKGARVFSNIMLATAMGADKFADAFKAVGGEARADELQPALVQEGKAKASIATTDAQFHPQVIQSDLATEQEQRQRMRDQTANEQADLQIKRDGLALEKDKLVSGIQMKLQELDQAGSQLDAGGRSAVNTAVGESVSSQQLAERMNSLADQFNGVKAASGWKAAFYEKAKGAFGDQDAVSGLRAQYNQIVNSQAVKNLPPGPASDKDIALAKQGFPPDTASPVYLQSFLRGMAKMQEAVAASADRKADWLAKNGGALSPVRRDTEIGGVMVPAGTSFTEFNRNQVSRAKQGQAPSSLQGILQKYGQ